MSEIQPRKFSLEAALMIIDACYPNHADPVRTLLAENIARWQGGMVDLVPRALELAEDVIILKAVARQMREALRRVLSIGAGDFNGEAMECYCGHVMNDKDELDETLACAVCEGDAALAAAQKAGIK
jgi:hypothetical protein